MWASCCRLALPMHPNPHWATSKPTMHLWHVIKIMSRPKLHSSIHMCELWIKRFPYVLNMWALGLSIEAHVQLFFYWVIYLQNVKSKKLRKCNFESFHSPKARAKKSKNCQIHICGFHCVGKHIEGWLRIWSLFLVYRNINPKKTLLMSTSKRSEFKSWLSKWPTY
jgi:hypothetical protein